MFMTIKNNSNFVTLSVVYILTDMHPQEGPHTSISATITGLQLLLDSHKFMVLYQAKLYTSPVSVPGYDPCHCTKQHCFFMPKGACIQPSQPIHTNPASLKFTNNACCWLIFGTY